MYKRIISMLICLLLVTAMPLAVCAEEAAEPEERKLSISTAEELVDFADNCRLDSYSQKLSVSLQADIDLTGCTFEGIPIFCGSFDGGNHVISGVDIASCGSHLGFFRYVSKDAVIMNLTVEGTITPLGSRQMIGGFAGNNAGTIENCAFRGSLSGADHVGGITGSNSVTGILEGCQVDADISGNHFIGGIAGSNSGVIRGCINNAAINSTAQQNSVNLSDITLDSIVDAEASYTVTDIGGIAGSSSGVIRSCKNYGTIGYTSIGYNIGGIAGSQMGFITECVNYGCVNGRKEVGGIAGQMEPVTNIEYTEDTLQILQGQLGSMASLANRASAHAQEGASDVSGHISGIQDSIQEAQDALDTLTEEGLDPDSLAAAENALRSSMQHMESNISGAAASLYDTVGTLSSDMRAISNQINAMQKTINSASENLGGFISDISDMDTPENIVGKVSSCENFGSIFADANAGGITGAIALENDLDMEEDLQITGDQSLNYDSELRAVIRSCVNHASVAIRKQNAGGIVGWMPMGLVKDCINVASVDSPSADYVGGIAGQSTGFIRNCSAKCRIYGDSFVGGIAGSANTVTDCRSIPILSASEKAGAIIGYTELSASTEKEPEQSDAKQNQKKKNQEDEKTPPIFGNLYTPVEQDCGGIDGISYNRIAQSMTMADFQTLENLPDALTYFTVRFVFASGTSIDVKVAPNTPLEDSQIPNLAIVDGRNAHWEELPDSPIAFDCVVAAAYDPLVHVLESAEHTESGKPVLLLEGAFLPDSEILAAEDVITPSAEQGETLLKTDAFYLPESDTPLIGHYLLEGDTSVENLKLYLYSENTDWQSVDFHQSGSYLVFSCPSGLVQIAIAQQQKGIPLPAIVCGLVVLVMLVIVFILWKKKRETCA